ncbi:MAG: tyrosine-type recombinase/integrase [Caulobacteraceae bacterium]
MGRKAQGLTAVKVKTAKPGRYGDGDGLYLFVRSADARFWVFRYTRAGRMREMGLGRAGDGDAAVKLADARDRAADLHKLVRAGIDPLDKREADAAKEAAEAQEAAVRRITFRTVTDRYLAAHEKSWRNSKHRAQWRNTLDTYANPHLGDLPVGDVATEHVLAALEPIWRTKPETATRVRGRIESVLDYAKARDWRTGENPARWRGHLANLLPPRSKIAPVEHHAALPWAEIGAFLPLLKAQAGVSVRALEFTILTAARSGEVLGARWGEIDFGAKVWTVPASRMKAGREHRVPLSSCAITLLEEMAKLRTSKSPEAFVFPGGRADRPLSIMAMTMTLRRMGRGDLTVHGFRSTFRDWVREVTGTPREVAEAALAHTVGDKTEAAYARGDLFAKRCRLMGEWARFGDLPLRPANLPSLHGAAVA